MANVEQNAVLVNEEFDQRLQEIADQLNETGEVLVQTAEDAGEVTPEAA